MNKVSAKWFAACAAVLVCGSAFAAEQTVEGKLFALKYDDAAGWTYDAKRDFKDTNKGTTLKITIPQADNPKRADASVEITAKLEDHHEFRRQLKVAGYDLKDYAAGAYTPVMLGGVATMNSGDRNRTTYYARPEGSGVTLMVKTDCGTKRAAVDTLLRGLTFKVADAGVKDAPWYWEGTPYAAGAHSVDVGSVKVNSAFVPIEPCLAERNWGGGYHIAVKGDKAFVVAPGLGLCEYSFDGTKLVKTGEISLGDIRSPFFRTMSAPADGTIWLGGVGTGAVRIKDGVAAKVKGPKEIVVAPDGTWGLEASARSGKDMKKYEISPDGAVKTVNFPLAEVDYMSTAYVGIDEKNIFVSGREKGGKDTVIFVYDHAGKLQKTLYEPKKLTMGGVFFAAETANGYVALPLQSSVMVWDKDGNSLGCEGPRAFYEGKSGVGGNVGGFLLDPDTVLSLIIRERPDMSSEELLVFRLSGF